MDNLITRLQLRTTVQDYITQLMTQNEISAPQMEDALEHVLLIIKDAALADYAVYAEQSYTKDKMDSIQNLMQSYNGDENSQIVNDQNIDTTSTPINLEVE